MVVGLMVCMVDDLEVGFEIFVGFDVWYEVGWMFDFVLLCGDILSDFKLVVWIDDEYCLVFMVMVDLFVEVVDVVELEGVMVDWMVCLDFIFECVDCVFS